MRPCLRLFRTGKNKPHALDVERVCIIHESLCCIVRISVQLRHLQAIRSISGTFETVFLYVMSRPSVRTASITNYLRLCGLCLCECNERAIINRHAHTNGHATALDIKWSSHYVKALHCRQYSSIITLHSHNPLYGLSLMTVQRSTFVARKVAPFTRASV